MNQQDRLTLVTDYLDTRNPIVRLAYQTGTAIGDAVDDAEKLGVFDGSVSRLHQLACEWVAEGFRQFYGEAQRASVPVPVEWADQLLRDYLEHRIGHQLRYETDVECELAPPYLWKGESPHKVIVWWVAQASSQEGDSLVRPPNHLTVFVTTRKCS